jgi:hypothetical protein
MTAEVEIFAPGGYRYLPGTFQYSGGVAAEPGLRIERATLRRPVPLAAGFELVEAHLAALRRPLMAFCACELRSPAPWTEGGFVEFNRRYVQTLGRWGIYDEAAERNPVARSNVCPQLDPPEEPSLYAFSYTVPAGGDVEGGFVVAGSGEAPEGRGHYGRFVVRAGDTSPEGMADKAAAVAGEMERRMGLLGATWADTTAVQLYTVFELHRALREDLVRRGAAGHGLLWHDARPPVVGLDFEMDCRGVAVERLLG